VLIENPCTWEAPLHLYSQGCWVCFPNSYFDIKQALCQRSSSSSWGMLLQQTNAPASLHTFLLCSLTSMLPDIWSDIWRMVKGLPSREQIKFLEMVHYKQDLWKARTSDSFIVNVHLINIKPILYYGPYFMASFNSVGTACQCVTFSPLHNTLESLPPRYLNDRPGWCKFYHLSSPALCLKTIQIWRVLFQVCLFFGPCLIVNFFNVHGSSGIFQVAWQNNQDSDFPFSKLLKTFQPSSQAF